MGGDPVADSIAIDFKYFNPLRPCGRRHCGLYIRSRLSIYFNPLRPCGRRPLTTKEPPEPSNISIHSARVGGDGKRARLVKINLYFNPLRPCGRRPGRRQHSNRFQIFQSTPPVWAETLRAIHPIPVVNIFQSTPPVWAETRPVLQFSAVAYISIHSARVGGDPFWSACAPPRAYFNPLRPCGRRRNRRC